MNTLVHETEVLDASQIEDVADLRDFIGQQTVRGDMRIVDSSNRNVRHAQLVAERLSDGSVAYSIRLLA